MDVIRLVAVKFLQFALLASLVPILGLFILAAFNEKARRILLWVMVVLASLSVLAYLVFAPAQDGSIRTWKDALDLLVQTMQSAVPVLVGLLVLGITAFLFGPSGARRVHMYRQQVARRRYLEDVLDWVKPRLTGFVGLEGRSFSPQTPYVRITGDSGSGKSTLLYALQADLSSQALRSRNSLVPILFDLDYSLGSDASIDQQIEACIRPANPAYFRTVLSAAIDSHQVCLLIDSSAQVFGSAFSSQPDRDHTIHTAIRIIETFDPARLVVALPTGVVSGGLERLAPHLIALDSTGTDWASELLTKAGVINPGKLIDSLAGSGWESLANRLMFLLLLGRFYTRNQRLPSDACDLLRSSLYPPRVSRQIVEGSLPSLASLMIEKGEWSISKQDTSRWIQPSQVDELEKGGLLRKLAKPDRIAFAHPLLLAYFGALAWKNGNPVREELLTRADRDPVLSATLEFFINIARGGLQFTQTVASLLSQPDPGAHLLAARSLLAMPANTRPGGLTEQACIRLLGDIPADDPLDNPDQKTDTAWKLLASLDIPARIRIYEQVFLSFDPQRAGTVLRQVLARFPDDINTILNQSSLDAASQAGQILAEMDPRLAMDLLCQGYESSPPERRKMMIELLGHLPHEASGAYLAELLQAETDEPLRSAILHSLVHTGQEISLILLGIITNPNESPGLRVLAAQLLLHTHSPELSSGPVIREIMRASRMPLPDQAHIHLASLLGTLGRVQPEGWVDRWETQINPYQPGRPLVTPDLFFGRDRLMHHLWSCIENGSPAVLAGERFSGKTTVLRQLEREINEQAGKQIPIGAAYLDLTGLQPHEFYETIVRAAIDALHDPAISSEGQVPRPYTAEHFERDLVELVNYMKANRGKDSRLVLMLDEADILNGYPQPFHDALRKIWNLPTLQAIVLILAGSQFTAVGAQTNTPFYSLFQTYSLDRLEKSAAIQLVSQPVAGLFQYDETALDQVLQVARGRPGELQSLCHKLTADMLASGEKQVTRQIVRRYIKESLAIRAVLVAESTRLLEEMIDWLEENPHATSSEVEIRMKQTWEAVGRVLISSARGIRKPQSS